MNISDLHEGNRDAWIRTSRGGYGREVQQDVELLRAGSNSFLPAELPILAQLCAHCDLAIHLQCSHDREALGLLNLGAKRVVGIDIS